MSAECECDLPDCGPASPRGEDADMLCDRCFTELSTSVECPDCREGCDVYECCVLGGGGRVVNWDYLCDRHRDHQGFHDCHPGCCERCSGKGRVPLAGVVTPGEPQ